MKFDFNAYYYLLLAKVYITYNPFVFRRSLNDTSYNATSITRQFGHDLIFKETDRLRLIFHRTIFYSIGPPIFGEDRRRRRAVALIFVYNGIMSASAVNLSFSECLYYIYI